MKAHGSIAEMTGDMHNQALSCSHFGSESLPIRVVAEAVEA